MGNTRMRAGLPSPLPLPPSPSRSPNSRPNSLKFEGSPLLAAVLAAVFTALMFPRVLATAL